MTIDMAFFGLMPVYATVQRKTGADAFGNDTFATGEQVPCRVEQLTRTVQVSVADGEAVMASPGDSVQLIIDFYDPPFTEGDRVTLPYGTTTRVMTVISQVVEYDENGPYYQFLTCQNNQPR